MAFSYSNGVITQTGTDTDLSGLTGLTGVVTTNSGSGDSEHTIYTMASNRLVISGTLTHNPDKEMLVFEKSIHNSTASSGDEPIRITGTYNLGHEYTDNNQTNYAQGTGIIVTTQPIYQFVFAAVYVVNGGTWNWYGGEIRSGACLEFENGATWNVDSGTYFNTHNSLAHQLRIEAANATNANKINVSGLTLDSVNESATPVIFTSYNWGNMELNIRVGGYQTGGSANAVPLQFTNTSFNNSRTEYAQLFNGTNESQAFSTTWKNSTHKVKARNAFLSGYKRWGYTASLRDITVNITDASTGSLVSDEIKYYAIDNDSGNRRAVNGLGFNSDQVYSGTVTNGSGDIDNIVTNVQTLRGNSLEVYARDDDRWINDDFDLKLCGYQYGLANPKIPVFGYTGRRNYPWTMLPDFSITESNQSTVAAYTEINSASEFYDRAKVYLFDNYTGETSTIVTRSGKQIDINSKNLNIDGTASSVFSYSTDITIKSSTFTDGIIGSGTVTVSNGVSLNGGNFESDINYQVGPSTITNVTANNVDFNTAGTYSLVGCDITNVTNSSGGNITLILDANSSVTTNTGPSITLQAPQTTVNFNNLEAGSQLVMYATGTATEIHRVNSTGTTEQYTNNSPVTFDFTVQKAGLFPVRQTNISVTAAAAANINVQQVLDRAYVASVGLNNTNVTVDTTAKTIGITTTTTVQNAYSYLIEAFINESNLRNIEFPVSTFGSSSFSLDLDYEFTPSTIANLSRDGFRYTNSGNVKAIYAAILSQGIASGLQAEYVQTQGGTVVDAQNTGNVDQVVKIFGDVNNGNFDYRNHLVFKVQANGYRQAEFDVVDTYGNLEASLYVISLITNPIEITLGDPNITGITLTDNTASPVAFDAGDGQALNYSFTITDTNNNSGENILRHFNHLLSTDNTLNGLDVFQYPEMILDNGAAYETLGGVFRKSSGDVNVGVRVMRGSTVHPDFNRLQSDNGTYGVVPVFSQGNVTNITAGSRLQIYNVTTSTEVINEVITGTSYSVTYLDGNDYTDGDTIRVRLTSISGTTAKLGFETSTLVTPTGFSVVANQEDDLVYNAMGVNGANITLFEADYVDTEIDLIVSSNFGSADLYPWWVYNLHTADGIRYFFGGIFAEDLANFRINTNTVDLFFDTDVNTNVYQNNDSRIYRTDGAYPVKAPTTGGGAIDLVWRNKVLIAETGVSGLTSSESAKLNELDKLEGIEKLTKLIPASL